MLKTSGSHIALEHVLNSKSTLVNQHTM